MSNLVKRPEETTLVRGSTGAPELLEPREVPLGGPRAMLVRRTLPQRSRSLIGAWCFLDHYGPEVTRMVVPPHPHTGLQTVSWLFAGAIEHRDSTGAQAMVLPGEVNLMTAGRGISHSEISPERAMLHGAQLWVVLPDDARGRAPAFEHYVPPEVPVGDGVLRVFAGELAGSRAQLSTFTPLVGAQLDLLAGGSVTLDVDPSFEHGVLVDRGAVRVLGEPAPEAHLLYLPPGRSTIEFAADEDARLLLIGGEPFPERIIMWWNFIGRDHDEVVAYRDQWQAEVVAGADPAGRFGTVSGDHAPLPAPPLPNVRLRPRENPRPERSG